MIPELLKDDSVHLTDWGTDIFLADIMEGIVKYLETWVNLSGGDNPPNCWCLLVEGAQCRYSFHKVHKIPDELELEVDLGEGIP